MAFLIGGANTLTAGYDIENSMRFDGTSAYAAITPTAAGNRRLWTFSCWLKRSKLGATQYVFGSQGNASTRLANHLTFNSNDTILLRVADGSGNNIGAATTNRTFRDTNAWYHLVWIMDTENDTAADRQQLWVNGSRITSWSAYQDITEDTDMYVNQDDVELAFGAARDASGSPTFAYFDGYLAELYFINAAALPPSNFGEEDGDSGIWKPKDAKDDLTFGTNGFYMEFKETGTSQNSSGIGADTSGNDNHYAVTNLAAIDQTTDTPTNNWCTINIRSRRITSSAPTHAEGNTKITSASANTQTHGVYGSIGDLKSGKWYYEAKPTLVGTDGAMSFGFGDTDARASDTWGSGTSFNAYVSNGSKRKAGTDTTDWGDTFDDDDIISVAIDLDNGAIYFAKNGTWQDSGDPTSGATKTGAAYTDIVSAMPAGGYVPASRCIRQGGGDQEVVLYNYGNPAFAISSSQADDNGYGNFEYDVPAGYYALCTKNLAEFG